MIVAKKSVLELVYKSGLYIAVGGGGFYLLYSQVEKVDNIFVFLSLAFFLFLVLIGVFYALGIPNCKQKQEDTISIKNDIFYHNNIETANLKNTYLFFELYECGKNIAVTLYQEKDAKRVRIFQRIIFSDTEFRNFLKLIQPYRKFDSFPWKKYHTKGTFFVCYEGFILDGREFFYDEVATLSWESETYYKRLAKFERINIELELKNKELIVHTFFDAKTMIYVKLAYIVTRTTNKHINELTESKKITSMYEKLLTGLQNHCV